MENEEVKDFNSSNGVLLILFVIFAEIIIFANHKDHAKLFLAMKVSEMHQQQMLNLLDSIPGKVLINKEPQEGLNPKCIYSNRKMNEFFGKNLVQQTVDA